MIACPGAYAKQTAMMYVFREMHRRKQVFGTLNDPAKLEKLLNEVSDIWRNATSAGSGARRVEGGGIGGTRRGRTGVRDEGARRGKRGAGRMGGGGGNDGGNDRATSERRARNELYIYIYICI